jgi:hypothetical protein
MAGYAYAARTIGFVLVNIRWRKYMNSAIPTSATANPTAKYSQLLLLCSLESFIKPTH